MTLQNCLELLKAYKKQMENPVNEVGVALTGDQRKHTISQSKHNYEAMLKHIEKKKEFIKKVIDNPDPKFDVYRKYKNSEFLKDISVTKKTKEVK